MATLFKIFEDVGVPPIIDYLSLDVEGAESLVMRGFPWEQYSFLVLTVERPKNELRTSLSRHGYHYLRRNSWFGDETWIHKSLPCFSTLKSMFRNDVVHPQTCMSKMGHPWPVALMK